MAANWGEYSSLLQLGFGIGIGVSVFRAPFDLLSKSFVDRLEAEFAVLERVDSQQAGALRGKLAELQLDFRNVVGQLDNTHVVFMIASVMVALVNWIFLVVASTSAKGELSSTTENWLIFISGPVYLLIGAVLAAITLVKLRPARQQLRELQAK